MTEASTAFPSSDHDHGSCVAHAVAKAEELCRSRGLRLTEIRRRVLELVWERHGPVGAYALLDTLRSEGMAAAPPTVYRALDFLQEQGLVHRIERLNAFVGCGQPDAPHSGQFLICSECGLAAEIDDPAIDRALTQAAVALGFELRGKTVELEGLCPDCRRSGNGR
ncbi:Fur family transcriptional regulator [Telmatospirillum sp. J64-1]|uniref:Fur family transcriptional regulator n=1 Tax=Telmatospirillum sp. J64-1 TaxID=2502183 RepID=UPI00115E69E9|nr:Fur family transcriptional regulator [Telmatospirillum sp. J64-1]